MSPRPGINVDISGPLFKKGVKITRDAMEDAVQELMELGEDRLSDLLRPRDESSEGVYKSVAQVGRKRASKGHYSRNVSGKREGLTARIDDGGKVEYGPWLEGTSSRNQTTRFKGYHSFRKVGQELEKKSDDVLEKHIGKAARRMRGG